MEEIVEIIVGLADSSIGEVPAVGETFDVTFTANDLRPDGRVAVFSLYTDVNFDPTVIKATEIKYNDNPAGLGFFSGAKTGEIDNDAGIINEVGASSSLIAPFPGVSPTVFTVTFEVLKVAPIVITTDVPEDLLSQTVVYGLDGDQRNNVKSQALSIDAPQTENTAPVATNDSVTGNEDTVIPGNVLANDTDADADDVLEAVIATEPTKGSVVLNTDGSFEYTPDADFNGSDSFTYTVSDGEDTDTGTVTVAVTPVNDEPVAANDTADTIENESVVIDVLTNDTDLEGDTLSIAELGDAANGTVSLTAEGAVEYTPNDGFSGNDSFTYTVSDGTDTDVGTVTVAVGEAANSPPAAVDDEITGDEDTVISGNVLSNDTDLDGDALNAAISTEPTNGNVVFNADGSFEYTPDADFNGTDSFTYTVGDGKDSDTGTVTVTVASVNDAPVAADDLGTVLEDESVTIDVLSNDIDVDGDTLNASVSDGPSNGSVSVNADGSFEYTPDDNFSGSDSFTYTVTDGTASDTGTVTVSVEAVNDAPVAANDSASTIENESVVVDVLANDTDIEGDALSIVELGDAANGTVTLTADGSVEYTPDAGFSGNDSFTYTVSDGTDTDVGTVTVAVGEAANNLPVAADDEVTGDEDTVITGNVLTNDTDLDGDVLNAEIATGPTNGSVVLNADGSFEYTPDADFNGSDSFTYTVSDGEDSDTGTVTVTVTPVNDAPVATDDPASVLEDESVTIDVLSNDIDVDGDTLSASVAEGPSNGRVSANADGSFEYTPDDNFNGNDSFTYTVSDGTASDTGTVTVSVETVNDAPVAANDGASTIENESVVVDVLANDTDPDGDALSIAELGNAANGSVNITAEGAVEYTPNDGFSGNDSFTYTVSDGTDTDVGTVTVAIGEAANNLPVAADDEVTGDEDTVITGNVLTNDTDLDSDVLNAEIATGPTNGNVVVNDDGSFEYTPNANFNGSDSFTYTVSDGEDSDTGTVTVTVSPVNDAPVAADDTAAVLEDESVTIDVLSNDIDIDGDTLSASVADEPSNGSVSINADGSFEYTPDADFNGTDSFTYTLSDGTDSTTGTVNVTVEAVNDAPVAVDDSASTIEDESVVVDVLANDTDLEGDALSIAELGDASNGTVTITAESAVEYTPEDGFSGNDSFTYTVSDGTDTDVGTVTVAVGEAANNFPVAVDDDATGDEDTVITGNVLTNDTDLDGDVLSAEIGTGPSNGSVTLNTDGSFEYTPNADFNGTDSFTYTVSDGEATDTGTVVVTVAPVNDAPVATDDSASVLEGESVTIDVLSNDIDIDGDTLSASVADDPANGSVSVNADGSFEYTPDAGFSGSDSFTYTLSDGQESMTGTVNVTVEDVIPDNTAPVAVDDSVSGDEDAVITGNVLDNDTDLDGDSLSANLANGPANGTVSVNADGSFEYTPDADFNGSDSFTYTVSDGQATDEGTVNISVEAVNDLPVAANDSASTTVDSAVDINVLANDSDVDGDALSVETLATPTNGTTSLSPSGIVTYTPDPGFSGSDSFTYTVSDGNGGVSNAATVNVSVQAASEGETIIGTEERDRLVGTPGDDRIIGRGGNDALIGNGGNDRIVGNDGNDRILGGDGDDNLIGLSGNDNILGGDGDDSLIGNNGRDRMLGGNGNDRLIGGNDNDVLLGNSGEDQLSGGAGNDRLRGGADNDRLFGGADNDDLLGEGGDDRLLGSSGDDRLTGGSGNDQLIGGSGNDALLGGSGEDRLLGGSGDDILRGGRGDDFLAGGQGSDIFVLASGDGTDTISDFSKGTDSIRLIGIRFGALDITQNDNSSFIMFEDQMLAKMNGVVDLTAADFN